MIRALPHCAIHKIVTALREIYNRHDATNGRDPAPSSSGSFIGDEGISMRGKIIEFRRYHDLKRARLYRQQAVPRGPAAQARLDQQIARISGLLGELEELARGAGMCRREF